MKAFLKSFVFAWRGIRVGAAGRNFRVMLAVTAAAVALGLGLGLSGTEWALVGLCVGLVLSLELMNTAGEMLVDATSPDFDPRFGRIKDLLAGAVLVAAIAAAAVGMVIFVPKIL